MNAVVAPYLLQENGEDHASSSPTFDVDDDDEDDDTNSCSSSALTIKISNTVCAIVSVTLLRCNHRTS
jgi:hypothetical protein